MKTTSLSLPRLGTIWDPSSDQVVQTIRDARKPGSIDEITLTVRDRDTGYRRRFWLWIKSDTELVAFLDSSDQKHFLVTHNASAPDDPIDVPYSGGGVWSLYTDMIIPTELGIQYALELLRTGDIVLGPGWRRLPI